MKFFKLKWMAPIAIALLLVGCSNSEDTKKTEEKSAQTEGSYTVKDDRGVKLTLEEKPDTVISLAPSNTQILYELGVGDKIVGASKYDTYPKEALKLERVAENNERIIELNPDVVFAYTMFGKEQVEQLEAAGIKVFVIDSPSTIDDIYGDIKQVAEVMGVEEEGDKVVSNIQKQIDNVKEKTANVDEKKKVYFEIQPAPQIWTIGSGTFQQEIIEASGVENIYADKQQWVEINEEDVIKRNPEAIITTSSLKNDILARQGWSTVTAIQNKEVYEFDNEVFSIPGPRIGEAAELLAKTIYPELFTK